ncbi:MAG TPA: hypothetical protein VIS56_01310 [Candidatus Saccharimonadales bacterium]
MHDHQTVDVDAWSQQWFGRLSDLDSNSTEYHDIARMVGAQLALYPNFRKVDAEDLGYAMELLPSIGRQNPYNFELFSVKSARL